MSPVIWWMRRDLRLHDNQALHAALATGQPVVPLFIMDPHYGRVFSNAKQRREFMFRSTALLDQDLRQHGGYLVARIGVPKEVIAKLVAELGATAVFAQEESDPYGAERDKRVAERVPLTLVSGGTIRPLGRVQKKSGGPYTVFTPYKKMWLSHPLPRTADLLPLPSNLRTPPDIPSQELTCKVDYAHEAGFPLGETAARARLDTFLDKKLDGYQANRDTMGIDGTSSLSPYLKFGLISPREAAVAALNGIARAKTESAREGAETWLSELIWRDFYHNIQYEFPHVRERNFRADYDGIAWLNAPDEFQAWCDGRTGYPIVDAAMRQLNQTGWMHNRARMIVASFLIKDLLIDWRWGEQYFMDRLLDGDGAANNGGWQWAAGTGTDAAPYFRIFNPVSQSKKFDAQGEYIRRWVPELRPLNNKQIHAPWEIPPIIQKSVGVVLGQDYPRPIVDHKMARERTLAAYKAAREKAK